MTTLSPKLSFEEFMKYKPLNADMLPDLIEFYNNNKAKFNHNAVPNGNAGGWRKFEQKPVDNWLIANKFKQTDDEKLYSQFRSILNKLSDSNFNVLAKEITTIKIGKAEHLSKLAELIFNKAIIEPKFANMYAKLSKELSGYSTKDEDNEGKVHYYRELLIGRCQLMFNECVSIDPNGLVNPIPITKTMLTKETAIGCMTFIGELYLCDLLTNKIINSCFLLLLMKVGQNKSHVIECICTLMKVCGKSFSFKCTTESNVIFDKIDKLIASNTLQNKEKYALMDIVDLKKDNKW